jgi:hypothetical protein
MYAAMNARMNRFRLDVIRPKPSCVNQTYRARRRLHRQSRMEQVEMREKNFFQFTIVSIILASPIKP